MLRDVSKYEFSTVKDVLSEKELVRKSCYIKKIRRLEYSLLGKELKPQTDIAQKQYKGLNKFFKSGEKKEPVTIKKETPTIKKYNKSDLIYNTNHSFYKYIRDTKKFDKIIGYWTRCFKNCFQKSSS